jgi:hypothetical protein
MTARTCGFTFTTTGRPCGNRVADGVPWCRAGHPCTAPGASDDVLAAALDRTGVRPPLGGRPGPRRPEQDRSRRATDLVRRAIASEDAERRGLRAELVLADAGTAVTLLGDPGASPTAREAVVQRFGRVGAFIVLGYEAMWSGYGSEAEPCNRPLERLVRDFPRLGALDLYELLDEIDGGPSSSSYSPHAGTDAHRWLHATYAVAARDGTLAAHHAYMRALDDVMRLVRPLVAAS